MEDKISVIIPTHNGSRSLRRCISSVVKQKNVDLEIIVVDDNGKGSNEQLITSDIIKELQKNNNIKYIVNKENMNGSYSRNQGIKIAEGNFLVFLDDDDELLENSLSRRLKLLKNAPKDYGVVFSSFIQLEEGKQTKEIIMNFDGNILEDFLLGKVESPSSVFMIKSEVIVDVGLWDETFSRHQDWEFLIRVIRKFKAIGDPEISVKRYVQYRHTAKNIDMYIKNRMYFLSKINPLIKGAVTAPVYSKHLDRHQEDIVLMLIKEKKILESYKWLKKTYNKKNVIRNILIRAIKIGMNKN